MPNPIYSSCLSLVSVEGKLRIIRDCGYIIDRSAHSVGVTANGSQTHIGDSDCVKRAGTFSVLMQYCSCRTDGCNAASTLQPPAAIGITSLIFIHVLLAICQTFGENGASHFCHRLW